jgi:hypothetical protein
MKLEHLCNVILVKVGSAHLWVKDNSLLLRVVMTEEEQAHMDRTLLLDLALDNLPLLLTEDNLTRELLLTYLELISRIRLSVLL